MKIGILTFHCVPNFGAVFQAYALKEYLKSLGHEVSILDYRPDYLTSLDRPFSARKFKNTTIATAIKRFAREVVTLPIVLRRKRIFRLFTNRYLDIVPFRDLLNNFDAIFFGSDQIWNIRITEGTDNVFWGVDKRLMGKKLVAYAASAGSVTNLQSHTDYLKQAVLGFHAIGVRETSLCNFISPFRKDVCQTVDPVILAGVDAFRLISKKPKKVKDYLLLFQLGHDPKAREIAEKIAAERHLELVEILSQTISLRGNRVINTISPENLLGLFEYSSYIVSSSFHGTVLALLFQKEFVYVQFNKEGGERVHDLLFDLNIIERHIDSDIKKLPQSPIDYANVSVRLADLRNKSIQFISNALS